VTDLFAVISQLDGRAVTEAMPPSVRREVTPAPAPRRDGRDVVLDLGPWTPRTPARHLVPALALLTPQAPNVRFELTARRAGAWSPWIATATLGAPVFPAMPASVDGLSADIDEVCATPAVDAVRLRVRVTGPSADAIFDVPWMVTLSASDGALGDLSTSNPTVSLAVPARTQMTEAEDVRLRICSPTSVGMALEYLGCAVPTPVLSDAIFHAPTDRYGVWPAAVRAAATYGLLGYLLRFPDWAAVAWCLGRGLPIVASVRYAAGELTHAAIPETTGHLIVITGLDNDEVLVNDPAAPTAAEVPRRYYRSELTRAWLERTAIGYVFMRPV
jgi:Peptidase_C39 like family